MNKENTFMTRLLKYFLTANWTRWIVIALMLLGAFYLGRLGREPATSASPGSLTGSATSDEAATTWTCSMHPQIQLPGSGKCPLCGMDLIPLKNSGDDAGPRTLVMSESDKALARIQTTRVERRFVESEIRMVGKVVYDETRLKSLSAWIPGRLDRLFVDYTGTRVTKGDHMVLLYSPELLEAQQSLIEAKKSLVETADERSPFLRDSVRRHLTSEREKLRLWGLTQEQISAIEERGEVEPHIQINAPLSGIVIHKNAVEGMYVETGTPIYTVADLSVVWIELDAYELDFPWIRYGQKAQIETEAYPGEVFEGWISFVPPYLDEVTRTKKVRVNVDNEDFKLKPGMFVRSVVRSKLAKGGRVMDPELAGKWICPMHHEVVKKDQGDCDVCGMDLVTATDLGFVTAEDTEEAPIVVPVTAVLRTGRRGVVYVEVPDTERPTFEGREVVIGPRAGDWYLILDGLSEGEVVVTNGNFKIDSALQIRAKPSMMSMPSEKKETKIKSPAVFLSALRPLYSSYFRAQIALSKDQLDAGRKALVDLGQAVSDVEVTLASLRAHRVWMELASQIQRATEHAHHSADIEGARGLFEEVSKAILEIEKTFGHGGDMVHRVAYCPMVSGGKGGEWLQTAEKIENPYFGASMYGCGEFRSEHPGMGGDEPPTLPEEAEEVEDIDEVEDVDDVKEKEAESGPRLSASDFRRALRPVYESYLALHRALAGDDLSAAKDALANLRTAAEMVTATPNDQKTWSEMRQLLIEKSSHGPHAADLAAARKLFTGISARVMEMEETFGHTGKTVHRTAFCPMANDGKGGSWIQLAEEVENPFFGSSMFRCGEIKAIHSGDGR